MRFQKIILALVLCLLMAEHGYAQRSKSKRIHTRSKLGLRTPKVRGSKAKVICPIFEKSQYPYQGIGFKLGDPFALTYKFFPNEHFSFGVDFGKASSGLYNRYFREKFDEYIQQGSDTLSDNAAVSYSFHRVKRDFVFEAKVLYHIKGDEISPGLQVYFGGGWQWKNSNIQYDYFYDLPSSNAGEVRSTQRQRFTMGPQAVAGIEYAYFQLPISAFMEVEFFTDFKADPGWQRFEGGVGLRYVF
ncbi:MAG TPA: hypothetical protein VGD65_04415 [Chryseosolibacter sp.]